MNYERLAFEIGTDKHRVDNAELVERHLQNMGYTSDEGWNKEARHDSYRGYILTNYYGWYWYSTLRDGYLELSHIPHKNLTTKKEDNE